MSVDVEFPVRLLVNIHSSFSYSLVCQLMTKNLALFGLLNIYLRSSSFSIRR